jgi:RNA polymerase sigma factor (sigma-70 family)
MTIRHFATVADGVRTLFQYGAMGGWADGQLVGQFLAGRDQGEAALGILIQRHGPRVLSVCRRVLGDAHLAEDAFQATFLVLVEKASRLQDRDLLSNWLYGVAYRTAKKARARDARRRAIERRAAVFQDAPAADPDRAELRAVIDEEIRRLPERYRTPLILCHLEGLQHQEAARRLGCPVGTVESRLSRARDQLRSRLVRRGLAPTSAAIIAAVLPSSSSASATPPIGPSLKAALATVCGLAGSSTSLTISLARREVRGLFWPHGGAAASTLVVCAGLAAAGLLAYQAQGTTARPKPTLPPPAVTAEPLPVPEEVATPVPKPAERRSTDATLRPVRSPSAVASPLAGITIDGRLDDWPRDLPRYAIRNRLVGRSSYDGSASDAANPAAWFMVGYDRETGLVYLAAEVRDSEVVADASDPFHTDALEVYVDGAFTERSIAGPVDEWPNKYPPQDMPVLQYAAVPGRVAAYADPRDANPSLVYGRIDRTTTRMKWASNQGVTTYEWAIQPFDRYPDRPTRLEPGKRIGLEVVVVDKDPSRSRPSFLSWGRSPRVFKGLDAGSLGELILDER